MDAPGIDSGLHLDALDGLSRIHRMTFTARRLWSVIRRECEPVETALRILEIGSGGGDVLTAMASAAPEHIFHGIDLSSTAVERARDRGQGLANLRFFVGDVTAGDSTRYPPDLSNPGSGFDPCGDGRTRVKYDVVFSSLFLHHFDDTDALKILTRCRLTANRLVLIDDLRRTRTGYAAAWLAGRLLSRSPVVRHDAVVSVAGAYTEADVGALARAAGCRHVIVTTRWRRRFLLAGRPE
jgi:SAM-dependent methyltransferase